MNSIERAAAAYTLDVDVSDIGAKPFYMPLLFCSDKQTYRFISCR